LYMIPFFCSILRSISRSTGIVVTIVSSARGQVRPGEVMFLYCSLGSGSHESPVRS
jgi:hypothetical protein